MVVLRTLLQQVIMRTHYRQSHRSAHTRYYSKNTYVLMDATKNQSSRLRRHIRRSDVVPIPGKRCCGLGSVGRGLGLVRWTVPGVGSLVSSGVHTERFMQAGVFWALIRLHVAGQIGVSIVGTSCTWAKSATDANGTRPMNRLSRLANGEAEFACGSFEVCRFTMIALAVNSWYLIGV